MTLRALPSEPDRYLNRTEMAASLRVSVSAFDKMRAAGVKAGDPCPQHTWGLRRVVFAEDAVRAWAIRRERAMRDGKMAA